MTTDETNTFEKSRTPEALKAILAEHSSKFYLLDSPEDVACLVDGNPDDLVDAEFDEGATNNDVCIRLEERADAMMWLGYELHRCLLLWRGRHKFGDSAEVVERRGRPKFGVMSIVDGKVTVLNEFDSITQSVAGNNPKAQARQLLRKLKG